MPDLSDWRCSRRLHLNGFDEERGEPFLRNVEVERLLELVDVVVARDALPRLTLARSVRLKKKCNMAPPLRVNRPGSANRDRPVRPKGLYKGRRSLSETSRDYRIAGG